MEASAGGGDLDRISALPDDLLHVILGSLGRAKDVTRTALLSRRWRRVWIHAKALSFHDTSVMRLEDRCHLAGFVDWALAHRADADMECQRVVGYAARRVVGSFHLRLPFIVPTVFDVKTGQLVSPGRPVVELPSHGRPTSISLDLRSHRLLIAPPAAAARYESLTELRLHVTRIGAEDDDGRGFGDFVSSCCPRLRRLAVSYPGGLRRLVLRVEALEELELAWPPDLGTLDVAAPNLRVLKLSDISRHCWLPIGLDSAVNVAKAGRITAPRLQEIGMSIRFYTSIKLDIQGLSSVRRLSDLSLEMLGRYCVDTGSLWLLANCTSIDNVKISLYHGRRWMLDEVTDLTVQGAPQFANIRSIAVEADSLSGCHLVASMSSLLLRLPLLRSLCIKLTSNRLDCWPVCCNHSLHNWNYHGKIPLEFLEEVKVTGFTGEDEVDLVSRLLESNNSIKSITLCAVAKTPDVVTLNWLMGGAEDHVVSQEEIYHKLVNACCTDRGRWHFEGSIYTWAYYTTKNTNMKVTIANSA
ncbi:hypothetical protein ACP4OV_024831 [Aristida adscensionis]